MLELRVIDYENFPLSLSPSCVTRKKTARKKIVCALLRNKNKIKNHAVDIKSQEIVI